MTTIYQYPFFNNRANTIKYIRIKYSRIKYKRMEITLTIKIVDMNHQTHAIEISSNTTGYELKTHVYTHLCQSLTQHEMDLVYEGAEFANNQRLSEFNVAVGTHLIFKQQKINLNRVANIVAVNQDDPISGENTFATKMPCGHTVTRDMMVALIRSLLSEKKYEIRCYDVDEHGNKCLLQWDFKTCKKIGVFTKEETQQFQEGLSLNWIKNFGKNCPHCSIFICKGDLKTNRVKCPGCKSKDFCYICLQPWKGGSQNYCGSPTCQFYNVLANAPWDRVFRIKDRSNGTIIEVKTPKLRMCPNCSIAIQNYISCKHTECKSCKKKFCWICLEVLNGTWTCGSYDQYCGKTAQVQKLK